MTMKFIDEIRRENLSALKEEKGGLKQLAELLGKEDSQVSQWIQGSVNSGTGKPRGMRSATAREIDAAAGKSAGWLDIDHSAEMRNTQAASMGVTRVPLISHVQAGIWTEIVDNFNPGDADDWLLTDSRLSSGAFALEIKGSSMLPEFKEGDRVIIDPDVFPQPGDFVVGKNGSEEATFKKYRPRGVDARGNEIFELVPLNEDFASIRSDQQPIKIVGTMVEHRKYRKR